MTTKQQTAHGLEALFNVSLDEALGPGPAKGTPGARFYFPTGLKRRYFRVKHKGRQERWFFWTLSKNANGKYVSGVYRFKGRVGHTTQIVEHRRRRDAKARAERLHDERVAEVWAKRERRSS